MAKGWGIMKECIMCGIGRLLAVMGRGGGGVEAGGDPGGPPGGSPRLRPGLPGAVRGGVPGLGGGGVAGRHPGRSPPVQVPVGVPALARPPGAPASPCPPAPPCSACCRGEHDAIGPPAAGAQRALEVCIALPASPAAHPQSRDVGEAGRCRCLVFRGLKCPPGLQTIEFK